MEEEERLAIERAEAARARVAEQIAGLIVDNGMTGSRELIGRRLHAYIKAEEEGDKDVMRAMSVELAVAAGLNAVHLDLQRPAAVIGSLPRP